MLDTESSLAFSSLLEMLFPSYVDFLSLLPSKFWGLVERRFDNKELESKYCVASYNDGQNNRRQNWPIKSKPTNSVVMSPNICRRKAALYKAAGLGELQMSK